MKSSQAAKIHTAAIGRFLLAVLWVLLPCSFLVLRSGAVRAAWPENAQGNKDGITQISPRLLQGDEDTIHLCYQLNTHQVVHSWSPLPGLSLPGAGLCGGMLQKI